MNRDEWIDAALVLITKIKNLLATVPEVPPVTPPQPTGDVALNVRYLVPLMIDRPSPATFIAADRMIDVAVDNAGRINHG